VGVRRLDLVVVDHRDRERVPALGEIGEGLAGLAAGDRHAVEDACLVGDADGGADRVGEGRGGVRGVERWHLGEFDRGVVLADHPVIGHQRSGVADGVGGLDLEVVRAIDEPGEPHLTLGAGPAGHGLAVEGAADAGDRRGIRHLEAEDRVGVGAVGCGCLGEEHDRAAGIDRPGDRVGGLTGAAECVQLEGVRAVGQVDEGYTAALGSTCDRLRVQQAGRAVGIGNVVDHLHRRSGD